MLCEELDSKGDKTIFTVNVGDSLCPYFLDSCAKHMTMKLLSWEFDTIGSGFSTTFLLCLGQYSFRKVICKQAVDKKKSWIFFWKIFSESMPIIPALSQEGLWDQIMNLVGSIWLLLKELVSGIKTVVVLRKEGWIGGGVLKKQAYQETVLILVLDLVWAFVLGRWLPHL